MAKKFVKLALFDLDQTLIDLIKLHDKSFRAMFEKVYGFKGSLLEVDFGGKPVVLIIEEICFKHGVQSEVAQGKMKLALHCLQDFFFSHLKKIKRVKTLPGVRPLLNALHKQEGVFMGIITGSPRRAALEMIAKAGIARFFHVIETGDDGGDKAALALLAKAKAEKFLGKKIAWNQVVIVGDSFREALAAKKLGAKSVSVQTGHHLKKSLVEAGTDVVFKDFSNHAKVARAILS